MVRVDYKSSIATDVLKDRPHRGIGFETEGGGNCLIQVRGPDLRKRSPQFAFQGGDVGRRKSDGNVEHEATRCRVEVRRLSFDLGEHGRKKMF